MTSFTRRKALFALAAVPVLSVLPFAPAIDPDDDLELGTAGMLDAKWLARWQRAAYATSDEHGHPMAGELEIVEIRPSHRAYLATSNSREETDELGAMALAQVEIDGFSDRICEAYRTADGTAIAILVLTGGDL